MAYCRSSLPCAFSADEETWTVLGAGLQCAVGVAHSRACARVACWPKNGIDHAAVPLGDRTCPCCKKIGATVMEDEIHFMGKCPCNDLARSTMVSEISAQYPCFRTHYDAASDLGRTKMRLRPNGMSVWCFMSERSGVFSWPSELIAFFTTASNRAQQNKNRSATAVTA